MMNNYLIRDARTNVMVNAFEGEDGKVRAQELVEIHNRFYPEAKWIVSEETA